MKIKKGSKVTIGYELWVNGEMVDSSAERGPLNYEQGRGQIIRGLERALEGREAGDQFEIDISPEDSYGVRDERARQEVPLSALPDSITPEIGLILQARTPDGQVFQAIIVEINAESVIIDFNHPLVGKILRFKIQVLSIV